MTTTAVVDSVREKVLQDYRKKLLEHKEVESRLKESESYLVIYYVDPLFCYLILEILGLPIKNLEHRTNLT